MKIENKTVYTFEEGDVIANTMYNWVAVRVRDPENGLEWRHTNCDQDDIPTFLSDDFVENALEKRTWRYMGNREDESTWW